MAAKSRIGKHKKIKPVASRAKNGNGGRATVRDVLQAVEALNERTDSTNARIDHIGTAVSNVRDEVVGLREDFVDLKSHVNDEILIIRESYDSLRTYIDLKQDKNSLLSSILFQLLNHRSFRWAFGALFGAVAATVVSSQWFPWIEYIVHFFSLI